MRIGLGSDVHQLVTGRDLIIGGEKIPYKLGLLGHSDADVLVHAICDALLGAAGLGDIGEHFPDSDPHFKNINSLKLLIQINLMLKKKGLGLINLDAVVFAQAPKISPYKSAMQKNIALALDVAPDCINIKATTTEELGLIGRGEGIGAQCVVLLEELANMNAH